MFGLSCRKRGAEEKTTLEKNKIQEEKSIIKQDVRKEITSEILEYQDSEISKEEELKKELEKLSAGDESKKLDQLKKYDFLDSFNYEELIDLRNKKYTIEQNLIMIEGLKYFKEKCPENKIITHRKLTELSNKYFLGLYKSARYTQEVPSLEIDKISKLKIPYDDLVYSLSLKSFLLGDYDHYDDYNYDKKEIDKIFKEGNFKVEEERKKDKFNLVNKYVFAPIKYNSRIEHAYESYVTRGINELSAQDYTDIDKYEKYHNNEIACYLLPLHYNSIKGKDQEKEFNRLIQYGEFYLIAGGPWEVESSNKSLNEIKEK
jgi:hypothetical protein